MKRAIVKGAVWMLLLKIAERSLGLVSILILARLLVPADFGLVAMAMSVIAFVELGNSFGFELALIQREQPTRQHYDTAWTLQIVFGACCALLNVVLAYPTAWFYGESRLAPVMLVLAAGWLIQSFENIGVVEFRRQMDFSREFAFLATKRIIGVTVTLSFALMFQTYWALVGGMIAGRVTGVALSYGLQPYRPRWSLAAHRDLFSFSSWIFVVNLLTFASNRSSHFIVGRLHGSVALGLYTVGSEIALLPLTDLAAPINRAVFPGYARTASPEALRQNFREVIGLLGILALPASFGVAAIAEPLVRTVLGDKWEEAVIFVQILALSGVFHAATSNHYSAWLALRRTGVVALVAALHVALLLPLMLVLSHFLGVVGIAYAELSATVCTVIVESVMLCRALRLSVGSYVAGLWRPVIAATAMAFGVTSVRYELTGGHGAVGSLFELAVAVPIGIVIYATTLIFLWVVAGRPQSSESLLLQRVVQGASGLRRKLG